MVCDCKLCLKTFSICNCNAKRDVEISLVVFDKFVNRLETDE